MSQPSQQTDAALNREIGEISAKLSMGLVHLSNLTENVRDISEQVTILSADAKHTSTHENRISDIERWRSWVLGAAAAAGFIGSIFWSVIVWIVKK